jgi:hypothetical protein
MNARIEEHMHGAWQKTMTVYTQQGWGIGSDAQALKDQGVNIE